MNILRNRDFAANDGKIYICREATSEDVHAYMNLAKSIFNSTSFTITQSDEFTISIEDQKERILGYQKNESSLLLLVETDGKIVGNIEFSANQKRRIQHSGEFGMGILKEYRNLGIGGFLLYQMLTWAQRNPKIEKVCLSVFANNESAIHLYQKFGFLKEGILYKAIKQADGEYIDLLNMYRYV